MKRSTLAWLPRSLILLSIVFAFLQITGIVDLPGSQVKIVWFVNGIIYYIFAEVLIRYSPVKAKYAIWLLAVFAVGILLNLSKFSAGLIQEGEISSVNRLEHFLGGLAIFYYLYLLQSHRSLGILFANRAAELFVIALFANFLNTIHEILELFFDLWVGCAYLIGPSVFDTNLDLLATGIGIFAGFSIQLVILRILGKPRQRLTGD